MKRIVAAIGLFLLSSCGFVQDELYEPGGFVGARANGFLPAVTLQQRFDRYMIITLVLAPTALETSVDAEDASATIQRVNALYYSLSRMQRAIECHRTNKANAGTSEGFVVVCDARQGGLNEKANWQEVNGRLRVNSYAFEQLEYEVQQDLFFIARAVVTNLELSIDVKDLVDFNPLTLAGLWRKVDELLPMFREAASRFRGGIIMYADISQQSCDPEASIPCNRLQRLMKERYRGISSDLAFAERDVLSMLRLASASFDEGAWLLAQPQYANIVAQIDHSCEVAYRRQQINDPEEEGPPLVNCASGFDGDVEPSQARRGLVSALSSIDPPASIAQADTPTPQVPATAVETSQGEGEGELNDETAEDGTPTDAAEVSET